MPAFAMLASRFISKKNVLCLIKKRRGMTDES